MALHTGSAFLRPRLKGRAVAPWKTWPLARVWQFNNGPKLRPANQKIGPPDTWRAGYAHDFDFGQPYTGITKPFNAELQSYLDPLHDAVMAANSGVVALPGGVAMEAKPTPPEVAALGVTTPYISGAMVTQGSFGQRYGYFEVRAKMPAGNGLWPAFWLLNTNAVWPPEIDVFEYFGSNPTAYYATVHGAPGHTQYQRLVTGLPDLTADFHLFGVEWTPSTIKFFFDREEKFSVNTPSNANNPMYLLVNMGVGAVGSFSGPIDSTTVLPARYWIDYVAAWEMPT